CSRAGRAHRKIDSYSARSPRAARCRAGCSLRRDNHPLEPASTSQPRRFPGDFMFQLTTEEHAALMLQNATSKPGRRGRRDRPLAVTEHGAGQALRRTTRWDPSSSPTSLASPTLKLSALFEWMEGRGQELGVDARAASDTVKCHLLRSRWQSAAR